MKSSIKDFFSKCEQIRRKLRIWSYLLKKSYQRRKERSWKNLTGFQTNHIYLECKQKFEKIYAKKKRHLKLDLNVNGMRMGEILKRVVQLKAPFAPM